MQKSRAVVKEAERQRGKTERKKEVERRTSVMVVNLRSEQGRSARRNLVLIGWRIDTHWMRE